MISGETIWITGASSGIGLAMAKQLARQGNRVIATARNPATLGELSESEPGISSMPCDVSDRSSVSAAAEKISAGFGTIDRLVVNAGTAEYFDLDKPDWAMMERVMAVNYFGAVNTVASALPLLRASSGRSDKPPQIVAMASLATELAFPRAEAYGASKAALHYFFDALRVDLALSIAVTVVQPGFVKTPLTDKNDFPMPFLVEARDAASRIIKQMEDRPRLIRFPKRLSMTLRTMRLFPGLWQRLAISKLRRQGIGGKQ